MLRQFSNPNGVAVGPAGDVYVADLSNHRVQRFTSSGTFVSTWGAFGSGDGQMGSPARVAVDLRGDVYVAEIGNDRIQKFTRTGTFLSTWGGGGAGPGRFSNPRGIAFDRAGNVLVADSGNDRVQLFTSTGRFIGALGTGGTGNGQFDGPTGVAVDAAGFVYVADAQNDRIQKFSPTGAFVTAWGATGSALGQFQEPSDVAIDPSGFVYVTDNDNHRIQVFTRDGVFRTAWGTMGSGTGQFNFPQSLDIDADGQVYVAAPPNQRIQKFGRTTAATVTLAPRQPSVIAGDNIVYDVTVANVGSNPLTDLALTDPDAPDCAGPVNGLSGGQSRILVCTQPTHADDAPVAQNRVTLTGTGLTARVSNRVRTTITGGIRGTVSGTSENLVGAVVIALRTNGAIAAAAETGLDGEYALALDAGTYKLAIIDPSGAHNFEFHSNTVDFGAATPLTVTGTDVVTVDPSLAANGFVPSPNPGSIGGKVTDAVTGSRVPRGLVLAFRLPNGLGGPIVPSRADLTNEAGNYTVTGLDAGQYVLQVIDLGAEHQPEWHANHVVPSELTPADVITVNAGVTTTVNPDLTPVP